MENVESLSKSSQGERWRAAAQQLQDIFEGAGWKVKSVPRSGPSERDFRVRRRKVEYAVELKAASEGRSDRLIPLFAQAALQLMRGRRNKALPLAVVSAPRIPRRAAEQLLEFAHKYVPEMAVGLFDFEGFRLFRGPDLEDLDAEPDLRVVFAHSRSVSKPHHLFSDLNQWMLKVLLAPELPAHLLSAPRDRYANASQLAKAADVSVMSAFRCVQQLQQEGYLHEASSVLALVRREDLFARWQASNDRPSREIRMRFRLPGEPRGQLQKVVAGDRACLALFAAAEALGLGFVHGVPPYLYVKRAQLSSLADFQNLRPCEAGEPPDLFLREAPAPQSVFRGIVKAGSGPVCDVIQIWLDVASHPARGREQADLIRQRVLDPIIRRQG
jgi:hypothetical protein